MTVVSGVQNGHAMVTVTGEIDTDTASELQTAIITAINDPRSQGCIVDLTGVAFLDSAGLVALMAAHTQAEVRRQPLRIVVDSNSPVIRPIEITGLDIVLRLYHTIDEALHTTNRPSDRIA